MNRLLVIPVLALLSGCVVVVEDNNNRRVNRQGPVDTNPPPPVPPPVVEVSWSDMRTVILREYFNCDWDLVGTFDFYETRHGIPEDDLFVLLFISQHSGVNFHEVVFNYERLNRDLMVTFTRHRMSGYEIFVQVPQGTRCPYAYENAYTAYWRRGQLTLTNQECHALFWLRLSVHYYGWNYSESFQRWDDCSTRQVRYTEVCRQNSARCGQGNRTYHEQAIVIVERPWVKVEIRNSYQQHREESSRHAEADIQVRIRAGQPVSTTPSDVEARRRREEAERRAEEERRIAEEEAYNRRVSSSVTVTWVDTRTVILREYFECDWKLVGTFEYYQTRHGISEEDLLVLLLIARLGNLDFHEVVVTYRDCNNDLYVTATRHRVAARDLFVDVPAGTACPPPYGNAYGQYWKRGDIRLTNEDCRALVWLRVSVHYYGWTPGQSFQQWNSCTSRKVAPSEAHRVEYANCGNGGKTYRAASSKPAERPWSNAQVHATVEHQRAEGVRQTEIDVEVRVKNGKKVAPAPAVDDIRRKHEEQARREESERQAREAEAKRREAAAAEAHRKQEEAIERAKEEAVKHKQEEEARRAQEEARRKAEADKRSKDREEEARRAQEAKKNEAVEADLREQVKQREEAERKAIEKMKKEKADAELRAAEEKHRKDEEEKRRAEEEARKHQPKPTAIPDPVGKAPATDEEKKAATKKLVVDLTAAINEYYNVRHQYPSGSIADVAKRLQERKKDLGKEVYFTFEAWMLDKNGAILDGYGHALIYRENARNWPKNAKDPKVHNKKSFDLYSCGKDGQDQGGEGSDDVCNWTAGVESPTEDPHKADEERKKKEEEARKAAEDKKAREDEARKAADEEKKRKDDEARKASGDADAKKKAEEEARKKAEEEKKKKEDEERRKSDSDAEAKKKAEDEARKKADEEKKKKEDDDRRKADEEKKRKEAEAKKAADAENRKKTEEEKKRKEDEERKKADEEKKRKDEEEARKKAEEEKNKKNPPPPPGPAGKAPQTAEEKLAATRKLIGDIQAALGDYKKVKKEFPTGSIAEVGKKLREKKDPLKPDVFFTFEDWMIDKDGTILDGWGRALIYRENSKGFPKNKKDPSVHNKETFDIHSCGADGKDQAGEGDDLSNWK